MQLANVQILFNLTLKIVLKCKEARDFLFYRNPNSISDKRRCTFILPKYQK